MGEHSLNSVMVKTCEKLDYCGKSQPFLILLLIADVITIDKTNENFRLLYDVKGRFTIHRIKQEEAMVNITSDLQNIVLSFIIAILKDAVLKLMFANEDYDYICTVYISYIQFFQTSFLHGWIYFNDTWCVSLPH